MKKDSFDTLLNVVTTALIAGVVYEVIYLKTHTFDFKFIDFFFVFCLYEVISIKRMIRRLAENTLNYATYLKIYMDVKFGGITLDNLKDYFEKIKAELERSK